MTLDMPASFGFFFRLLHPSKLTGCSKAVASTHLSGRKACTILQVLKTHRSLSIARQLGLAQTDNSPKIIWLPAKRR
ncbi:MAG: hypothetical protein ACKO9F_16405, partial [Caldilinea sp.]